MSRRSARDRFRQTDKDPLYRRAGGRCEYYPESQRHGVVWLRCRFASHDPRYFQMGHAVPVNADDQRGRGVTDWELNGLLQCVPCNLEQSNEVQPDRVWRLIDRDRANLAAGNHSRWAMVLLAVSAAGLFAVAMVTL